MVEDRGAERREGVRRSPGPKGLMRRTSVEWVEGEGRRTNTGTDAAWDGLTKANEDADGRARASWLLRSLTRIV